MENAKLLNIRVENNIIMTPDVELQFDEGLGTIVYQKLQECKNGAFQIDGVTEKIDTCGAYLKRCIRTAIAMRARGVTPNDIITVCSTNHFNTSVPIIAGFFLGAIPANTDPNLPLSDTIHLLKLVQPKLIFVSTNSVELMENVLKETEIKSEIVVFGDTEKHTPFSTFLEESEEENNFKPYKVKNLQETAAVFFSSGTSGLSKGVCLSHATLLKTLQSEWISEVGLPDDVLLSSSLVYWISYTLGVLYAIFLKMSRLILPTFESSTMWGYIKKYKVNILILSPTQIATLLKSPQPEDKDVSSVRLIVFGGSSFSEEQIMKVRSYVPNAISLCGYGSTEMGGSGISFMLSNKYDLSLLERKPTSCGRPLPGKTFKIVDPDTEQALGPNQEGELRIKSRFQMSGYYKMDSSNEWDDDGYFKTGDVAYYDQDYCFYIVGRFKEMIKYQGWQITPIKLEELLKTHPAVKEVVVLGIPHPIDVEHPVALVVLNEDYNGKVSPEEIKEHYHAKVSDIHKLRGGLKFVNNLLKTATGKIKRREMLKLLLENKF